MAIYGKSRIFTNIGIVNQDKESSPMLSSSLEQLGLLGHYFESPYSLLNHYSENWFKLIIINHHASSELMEMARWIGHQATSQTSVLIWAPQLESSPATQSTDLGAVSMLEKPCPSASLAGKINGLLRGEPYQPTHGGKTAFGTYEFYVSCCQVKVNDEWIGLTQKQFDLALLLFKHEGQCISKQWIARKIWGASLKDTSRTLDTHISVLRKKLHLHENDCRIISVYGSGYQFCMMPKYSYGQVTEEDVFV